MRTVLLSVTALVLLAGGCTQRKASPESTPTVSGIAKTIRTKTGIDMALIPAGEFVLGDDRGESDEKPAHRVRLAAFYMDVCEVTQASFQAILGRNPSKARGPTAPWSASVGMQPCSTATCARPAKVSSPVTT